jgi:GNAT superfamily N-acetyltransferase
MSEKGPCPGVAYRPRPMEIAPFAGEHLDAASELLAARHRRHRTAEPLLPERFEDPDEARRELEAAWREPDASGFVALSDKALVGYLIGAPRTPLWGPNVWSGYAGHAAEDAETVRDLYAAAASGWVDRGWTAHYALVPAFDAAVVDAWFQLVFGQMHVHAIRETPPGRDDGEPGDRDGEAGPSSARSGRSQPVSVDFDTREATIDDLEELLGIDHLLPDHLMSSPVFSVARPDPPETARKEWLDALEDERTGVFVAFRDRRIVGTALGVPADYSPGNASLARPDGAGMLAYIATRPEVRGSGAGLALTNAVYRWARNEGYATLLTDWRAANLPSSRFFRHGRGFRPTFFRLHRLIAY